MRVTLLFIVSSFVAFNLSAQSLRYDTTNLPKPKFFELAFLNDSTIEYLDAVNRFYVKQYGTIKITTGKIVLSDFEGIGRTLSFVQTFPKGEYPVEFSIGLDIGHTFLAYARILFAKDPVVRWEYALRPTERPKTLTDRTFDTCVYSETGYAMYVFGDSTSHKYLREHPKVLTGSKQLTQFKVENYFDYPFKAARFKSNNHSLVAISGEYKACYAAFIGYNKAGKICRLLIDPQNYSLQPSSY